MKLCSVKLARLSELFHADNFKPTLVSNFYIKTPKFKLLKLELVGKPKKKKLHLCWQTNLVAGRDMANDTDKIDKNLQEKHF